MKKTPIIVAGVAGLVLAGLLIPPYLLGLKAEQGFNERIESIAAKSGLKVGRVSFERGWFSSRAETLLQLPGAPVEIAAQHTVYHGPLLLGRWLEGDYDTRLMQAQIETRGEFKISAKQPSTPSATMAFSSLTRIALDGDVHSHVDSPPISRSLKDGKLEWRGLQGDIRFDADTRGLSAELRAPGLTFATAEITDIVFRSDVHEGIAGHYLGKNSIDVASASFAPLFQMKKLRIASDTGVQGETLSMRISYDLADIQVADKQYGPARLALELRKLDAVALAKFQEELRALQSSGRPAEQLGMLQVARMLQLVGELARKSPELEISELRFRVDADEVRGKAKLVLDGSKSNLVANPMLMLTALSGDLDISLPPTLIKPMLMPLLQADLESYRQQGVLKKEEAEHLTPQQLSAILDRMLPTYLARNEFTRRLAADGDRYRLNASLRRGQVLVNGEPINMSGMGMLPALKRE